MGCRLTQECRSNGDFFFPSVRSNGLTVPGNSRSTVQVLYGTFLFPVFLLNKFCLLRVRYFLSRCDVEDAHYKYTRPARESSARGETRAQRSMSLLAPNAMMSVRAHSPAVSSTSRGLVAVKLRCHSSSSLARNRRREQTTLPRRVGRFSSGGCACARVIRVVAVKRTRSVARVELSLCGVGVVAVVVQNGRRESQRLHR